MLCNSIDHMPAIYKTITKTLYNVNEFCSYHVIVHLRLFANIAANLWTYTLPVVRATNIKAASHLYKAYYYIVTQSFIKKGPPNIYFVDSSTRAHLFLYGNDTFIQENPAPGKHALLTSRSLSYPLTVHSLFELNFSVRYKVLHKPCFICQM